MYGWCSFPTTSAVSLHLGPIPPLELRFAPSHPQDRRLGLLMTFAQVRRMQSSCKKPEVRTEGK